MLYARWCHDIYSIEGQCNLRVSLIDMSNVLREEDVGMGTLYNPLSIHSKDK